MGPGQSESEKAQELLRRLSSTHVLAPAGKAVILKATAGAMRMLKVGGEDVCGLGVRPDTTQMLRPWRKLDYGKRTSP